MTKYVGAQTYLGCIIQYSPFCHRTSLWDMISTVECDDEASRVRCVARVIIVAE